MTMNKTDQEIRNFLDEKLHCDKNMTSRMSRQKMLSILMDTYKETFKLQKEFEDFLWFIPECQGFINNINSDFID